MKPTLHPSTTRALGAPANWEQDRLPVEALPITDHHIDGVPCIASFWQPDASELAVLNAGGLVMLNVVGRTMQPVSLTVTLAGTVPTKAAAPVQDDGALDKVMQERDTAEDWADSLADLIGRYFGHDVGEHSSAHCPWQEAKAIIEGATPYKPASNDLREQGNAKQEGEYVTVPVLANFAHTKPIGDLRILKRALPPQPGFVFSLGIKCLEEPDTQKGEIPTKAYTGPYELMCVSPVQNENYISYLRQVGLLPPAETGHAIDHVREGEPS